MLQVVAHLIDTPFDIIEYSDLVVYNIIYSKRSLKNNFKILSNKCVIYM